MSLEFTVSAEIPAKAEEIYCAWLDSETHAAMTAADSAVASQEVGGRHKAHGDYIWGVNIELIPNKTIIQSWRTSQFNKGDEDSIIEISLDEQAGSTTITLKHGNLPDGDDHYKQGWIDYYFTPMKAYFSALSA